MRETWYVLDDGRKVDPNECAPNDSGALVHSSGVAVAMRAPGVPRTSGVDADEERARSPAAPRSDARGRAKAMKPEDDKSGYKTRESKAD